MLSRKYAKKHILKPEAVIAVAKQKPPISKELWIHQRMAAAARLDALARFIWLLPENLFDQSTPWCNDRGRQKSSDTVKTMEVVAKRLLEGRPQEVSASCGMVACSGGWATALPWAQKPDSGGLILHLDPTCSKTPQYSNPFHASRFLQIWCTNVKTGKRVAEESFESLQAFFGLTYSEASELFHGMSQRVHIGSWKRHESHGVSGSVVLRSDVVANFHAAAEWLRELPHLAFAEPQKSSYLEGFYTLRGGAA